MWNFARILVAVQNEFKLESVPETEEIAEQGLYAGQ